MKYDLTFLELELRELLKKLKKHNTYAMQLEDEIRLYALENARLKESEEYHRKGFAELHKRIDEAIEYINNIKEQWTNKSVPEKNIYLFETYLDGITELIKIKDILRGEDDEN